MLNRSFKGEGAITSGSSVRQGNCSLIERRGEKKDEGYERIYSIE